MARIPMKGDPPRFDPEKELPRLKASILRMRDEHPAQVADAEARGDQEALRDLAKQKRKLDKLIADYGLD